MRRKRKTEVTGKKEMWRKDVNRSIDAIEAAG